MSEIEESFFDGWDRTFLGISAEVERPIYWTYGLLRHRLVSVLDPDKFDNSSSKTREIARRGLIVVGATVGLVAAGTPLLLGAVALETISQITYRIGMLLQKGGFTHARGCDEQPLKSEQASVMIWNVRGQRGGMHYVQGGVVHWRSRIDEIVKKILIEDPDVLVLQEVKDGSLAEALIAKLKEQYSNFYFHLSDGAMVITKCAVQNFVHTPFEKNGGFETFEIKADPDDHFPCARFVEAQLEIEQMSQIVESLSQKELSLPTVFIGNIQIKPSEEMMLANVMYHSYRDPKPTRTGKLALQWDGKVEMEETRSDFISLFRRKLADGRVLPAVERNVRLEECHLIEAFDGTYNTKTALSDHHGVEAKITLG